MTEPAVERLLRRALRLPGPLLLALDVDGTLSPIVEDPTAATVAAPVARALRRLARVRGVHVALVTGRDARALSSILRVAGAHRAVEHGRFVLAPGQRAPRLGLTAGQRRRLLDFESWVLSEAVAAGGELESKPSSRALHVRRLARRNPRSARRLLALAAVRAIELGLHPRPGRAVLEASAFAGDKAAALAKLRRATRCRAVVYVGDDMTDLPAIAYAVEVGGLGVFVRSTERPRAPRGASASLSGTDAVASFVIGLADALG